MEQKPKSTSSLSSSKPPRSEVKKADLEQAPPQTTQVTQLTVYSHSGPLPDPRTLEYYERICPGAANEIMGMAKAEQKARHWDGNRHWISHLCGLFCAFLLALAGITGAVVLLWGGRSLGGFCLFLGSLGTLIGAAIWKIRGTSQAKTEQEPARPKE